MHTSPEAFRARLARHAEALATHVALVEGARRVTFAHGHPVGFFGMVQVLEGTSTALATQAAERLQASLELPDEALRYLTSHGSLDIGHLAFFEGLVNRLEADDLAAVIDTARLVYRLYGAMFRGVEARCSGGSAARELADALA
ncbi:iron-containing redox enzyme family protein [Halomonas sp. H10-9-1]|uniref:iron-containing redox enzyme family protein n=1 Tax=Halomonas sp. H10-9-1 TaxID=2950871 RepID=UPI0032DF1242